MTFTRHPVGVKVEVNANRSFADKLGARLRYLADMIDGRSTSSLRVTYEAPSGTELLTRAQFNECMTFGLRIAVRSMRTELEHSVIENNLRKTCGYLYGEE